MKQKVIAICNQKGGVGKTTTALAIAAVLAKCGHRVLAVDCDDGNASLTKNLGYDVDHLKTTLTDLLLFQAMQRDISQLISEAILESAEQFDVLPADSQLAGAANILANGSQQDAAPKNKVMRNVVQKIQDVCDYDYIIIDTAPTLNVLFINALAAADEVVIVTQSQPAAEAAIGELLQTIIQVKQLINPKIIVRGLLVTMLDTRTKYEKEKSNHINDTYSELGMRVFENKIPRAIAAVKCVDARQSIIAYDTNNPAAQAYYRFVNDELRKEAQG